MIYFLRLCSQSYDTSDRCPPLAGQRCSCISVDLPVTLGLIKPTSQVNSPRDILQQILHDTVDRAPGQIVTSQLHFTVPHDRILFRGVTVSALFSEPSWI